MSPFFCGADLELGYYRQKLECSAMEIVYTNTTDDLWEASREFGAKRSRDITERECLGVKSSRAFRSYYFFLFFNYFLFFLRKGRKKGKHISVQVMEDTRGGRTDFNTRAGGQSLCTLNSLFDVRYQR